METTASGLLIPEGVVEHKDLDATSALDRHFEGMRKLERYFPRLVKMTVELANMLTKAAKAKGYGPESVMLAPPSWTDDGYVMVKVGIDTRAKKPIVVDDSVKTYATLQMISLDMPALTEFAMTIAFQLVPAVNARKLRPGKIHFSKPGVTMDGKAFAFRITIGSQGLALPSKIEI